MGCCKFGRLIPEAEAHPSGLLFNADFKSVRFDEHDDFQPDVKFPDDLCKSIVLKGNELQDVDFQEVLADAVDKILKANGLESTQDAAAATIQKALLQKKDGGGG